jgi:antirestriction protein ArdC
VSIPEGHRACYLPAPDTVCMPAPGRFERAEAYDATLFHELCHASGHPRRLNRPSLQTPCPFGSAPYSEEELVAEMGAALLGGVTGIDSVILDNSAAYIDFWLSRVQKDPRLFLRTASQGQKAADFILGITADRVLPTTSRVSDTAVACSP